MLMCLGEQSFDPSCRVLLLPLGMMDGTRVRRRDGLGLPAGALEQTSANLIMASTPCDAPLFREALTRACAEAGKDILLVRTGLFPETLNSVICEVALAGSEKPLILTDLCFMRADGRLWLVPQDDGPVLEVRHDGLDLQLDSPFADRDERGDGVSRAASEIVRLYARAWRG